MDNKPEFEVKDHPERHFGETFFGNFESVIFWGKTGWATKRLGDEAYDINGNVVQELSPGFIQMSEIIAKGFILIGPKHIIAEYKENN